MIFPSQAVQNAYILIVVLLLVSFFSLVYAWFCLVRVRKRIFYIPVFSSSLLLLLALSFAVPAMSSGFVVSPNFGPVKLFVDKTSPVLLKSLRSVDYGVEVIPSTLFNDNSDNVGEYNGLFRSITMVGGRVGGGDVEFTYWHELGHHVWFWLLTDSERVVWQGVYDKDLYIFDSGGFPYFSSEYASSSVEEDFAESFARFVYEFHVDDSYRWNYRTENLDSERVFLLNLFLQRLFVDSGCSSFPVVSCVVVGNSGSVVPSAGSFVDGVLSVEVSFI